MRVIILLLFLHAGLAAENSDENRLLICGVCRNVSGAIDNTIHNIEQLGSHFADYAVIIYENNSSDDTASKLATWAQTNERVVFLTEKLSRKKLSLSRTVRIANARNMVLEEVKKKKYDKYRYLVMVDLDFKHAWPIQEIVYSINQAFDWDCISANGITGSGFYYDRFAFRSLDFPLGPELLDQEFWADLRPNDEGTWFKLSHHSWLPVYSAFGGLAIYKTDTIKKFSYSGTPTPQLRKYYKNIFASLAKDTPQLVKYQKLHPKKNNASKILFRKNCREWQSPKDHSIAVCEHVPLHAAMALKGYRTFYVNPKLIMQY